MTIEVVFEADCDACGCCEQHADFETKARLWAWLKEGEWKRRGVYIWCPDCVTAGHFKANYIDWKQLPRQLEEAGTADERSQTTVTLADMGDHLVAARAARFAHQLESE
jgi:hypothetical protein